MDLPAPLNGNRFWTTDGNRFLRPNWELPWSDNQKAWSNEVLQKLSQKGHEYYSGMSQQQIAAVPKDRLETAIQTAFTSLQSNWRLSKQSKEKREQFKRKNRRSGRKIAVCAFHV